MEIGFNRLCVAPFLSFRRRNRGEISLTHVGMAVPARGGKKANSVGEQLRQQLVSDLKITSFVRPRSVVESRPSAVGTQFNAED